ncbi:MAG: hypothetical protein CMJ19_23275 [Phycisphaeraceae bacterium]|nr:hypothetical protein [Phycisphaeraceae bacterium]
MYPKFLNQNHAVRALILLLLLTVAHASFADVTVEQISKSKDIATYQMIEWQIDFDAAYENPFDPDQVKVDAQIQTPSGKRLTMPAFYLQPYDLKLVGENEKLKLKADGQWRLRFAPRETGSYNFHITVKDQQGQNQSQTQTFTVKASDHPGMIGVSKQNPKTFVYENNEPYIPIGLNICTPPGSRKDGPPQRVFVYDQWFKSMNQNGMNFGRLWLAPVFNLLSLWDKPGKVDQEGAARIDYVMQQAEEHDVAIMLCIDVHLHLQTKRYFWKTNPMKRSNGGPITWPTQMWENEEAIRLFKNRLRYLVARWGYSPSVFAWELWNEVNLSDQSQKFEKQITDWHALMADYIREIDPYQHMITTSTAHAKGPMHMLDALDKLDFVQTHFYGNMNSVKYVRDLSAWHPTEFGNKPHLFGEFGPSTKLGKTELDTQGVNVKNAIWAGMFVESPATPMLWWWSGYIDQNNLWELYGPLSAFMKNVPVAQATHTKPQVRSFQWAKPVANPKAITLDIAGTRTLWENARPNQPTTLTVKQDGSVQGSDVLSQMLHGQKAHPKWHNPLTIDVEYQQAGTFAVIVTQVSKADPIVLNIIVDGKSELEESITRDQVTEPNTYQVNVPKGKHQIQVINTGRDWAQVSYQLTGPVLTDQPFVNVMANAYPHAKSGQAALIGWLHNRQWVWIDVVDGKTIDGINSSVLELEGLVDGSFDLQWWDTTTGKIQTTQSVTVRNGQLKLDVPAFKTDIAFKLVTR